MRKKGYITAEQEGTRDMELIQEPCTIDAWWKNILNAYEVGA